MKKIILSLSLFMVLLASAALFSACGEGAGEPPAEDGDVLVQTFELDKESVSLQAGGDPVRLTLSIANIDETPVWISNKPSVVRVSPDEHALNRATLYGLEEGNAVVSVQAGKFIAVCKVTVEPRAFLTLETEELEILEGRTATIRYTSNLSDVRFSSGDPAVATVNGNGLVSALSEGYTTITVTAGGISAYCRVHVVKPVYPYVSLDASSIVLSLSGGATQRQLIADANGEVEWSSSDEGVATVENGLVTAISGGEAVITAKNGSAEATCTVHVKPFTISLSESEHTLPSGESFVLTVQTDPAQTETPSILWSVTEGEEIVSVTEGTVVSLGPSGEAVVRAAYEGDPEIFAECVVTVPAPYADWIAISDAASLRSALSSGNETKNMYLTADIDLGGENLNSTLAYYSGTFDGCGHSITNFSCGVLFGNGAGKGLMEGGTVKRLSLTCTLSDLGGNLGLFGMEMGGSVENCFFDITFGTVQWQAVFARNCTDSASVSNTIIVTHNPAGTSYVFAGTTQGGRGNWQNVYCNSESSVGENGPRKADLTSASLYADWDADIWEIADGSLPRLKATSLGA